MLDCVSLPEGNVFIIFFAKQNSDCCSAYLSQNLLFKITGWWYTYPSETYESQLG